MVFAPIAPPVPLAVRGPFAALTIDAQRRRVFAAGARSVAVLDADSGKLLATVRLGGARSIAIEHGGDLVLSCNRADMVQFSIVLPIYSRETERH